MDLRKTCLGILAVALCTALTTPLHAFAAGTGDDPRQTRDVLTRAEAGKKALEEARFAAWTAGLKTRRTSASNHVRPTAIDAPYYYMWTPSHAQERKYWCGPATSQIIDDHWGAAASQSSIASYLRTSESGTDFTLVDDALRYFTGKSYYYYGSLASESAFMDRVNYGIVAKHYPMATDVRIYASVWPNYVYDHLGHIIPLEAYDGRYGTIRVNDPYSEAYWQSGGGATYGHRTYSHDTIWNGVYNHFRRAVVS